jgi:SAM-dependent methyltransferase
MRWYHGTLISLAGLLTTMEPLYAQVRSASPQGAAAATSAAPRREDWQRPQDILAALGATTGSRIADLGAGEGWLTLRIAKQVGPTGRVFASDISDDALSRLGETVRRDSLGNVELVLAEDDDPRLPFGTLDGVVILNAYHEMNERVAVLDGVKRALRPGGVFVIVDNVPADSTARTRKEQTSRHSLALEFARDDLEAHGFEIVSQDPAFVDQKNGAMQHRQWMLIARRAKK